MPGHLTGGLVTLKKINDAYKVVKDSCLCVRTPLLSKVEGVFDLDTPVELYLKLENSQITGSFKVRGLANQIAHLPTCVRNGDNLLLTESSGNYGKAMSFAAQKLKMKAKVLIPDSAPANRKREMEGYGATVECWPQNELQLRVKQYITDNSTFYLDPSDDLNLIAGHASCGLEILEELPFPDIIAVCCGAGGFVSGVAAAVKLLHRTATRIYAVEPENGNVMYKSLEQDFPASLPTTCSVALGLSTPNAGTHTFHHCKEFVDGVLLVSDDEIIAATKCLYQAGHVVEPAGAAAFAALLANKIPNAKGKKVVIVLSGGNILPQHLCELTSW